MNRTCIHPDCDARLIPWRQWEAMTAEDRAEQAAQGYALHAGRNLCTCHYQRARRAGTLRDYEPAARDHEGEYRGIGGYTRAEILQEWEHLHDPHAPFAANCRAVGERLGIPARTLEQRLYRAGVRSPLVNGGHAFKAAA